MKAPPNTGPPLGGDGPHRGERPIFIAGSGFRTQQAVALSR